MPGSLATAWYWAVPGVLAATLLYAGLLHLRDRHGFATVLRSHGLLRPGLAPAVAGTVAVVEVAAALALTIGPVAAPAAAPAVVGLTAALFGCFAGYLAVVYLRAGPGAGLDCGCGGLDRPLARWSWIRPAGLGAVALLEFGLPAAGSAPVGPGWRVLAVASGWTIATGLLSWRQLSRLNADALAAARDAYRLDVGPGTAPVGRP